jgi:hypothetical protein
VAFLGFSTFVREEFGNTRSFHLSYGPAGNGRFDSRWGRAREQRVRRLRLRATRHALSEWYNSAPYLP